MPQKQLSAKQYIQTKARNLPVHKCWLSHDWQEASMAQVIVMRKHVNGNVTSGIYLVDLYCLGVKDTAYFFNEPEKKLTERLGDSFDKYFKPVEYALAHNIVYAGHDFAKEFDIRPHADFAITQFILEEDDDSVPLIEIEVGDEGRPHLMVDHPGQHSEALAKLKKNAGEGNYEYTINNEWGEDEDFDEDEEHDEEDVGEGYDEDEYGLGETDESDEEEVTLDGIAIGKLTVLDARLIDEDELLDEGKVAGRLDEEKLTIGVEVAIRSIVAKNPGLGLYDGEEEDEVTAAFLAEVKTASWVTEEQEADFEELGARLEAFLKSVPAGSSDYDNKRRAFFQDAFEQFRENPLAAASIFELVFFDESYEALRQQAESSLITLSASYPIAKLSLALAALINNEGAEEYELLYNSTNIEDAFKGHADFGLFDITRYGLLKALAYTKAGDLRQAIYYYYLAGEADEFCNFLGAVQVFLLERLLRETGDWEEYNEEEGETGGEDKEGRPPLRVV